MRIPLLFLLGCLLVQPAWSQADTLQLLWLDADSAQVAELVDLPPSVFTDTTTLLVSLEDVIENLRKEAYWEVSLDTLVRRAGRYTALMHLGPRYKWVRLQAPASAPAWFRRTGFRERSFREKPFSYEQWENLQARIVKQAANQGYPFASVYLDSLQWESEGALAAQVGLDLGPLILFEDLYNDGPLQLKANYLYQYLGWQPLSPYREDAVQRIGRRIQELPFAQLTSPPKVEFVGDRASVRLELAPKRASRFDFIVGVLPNSQQTGRLLVTAQLDGELQNALGQGEALRVKFEQLRPQTQRLDVAATYPYLLGLPFGLEGALDLYRRDTNYLDLGWQLGLRYQLDGARSLRAFWAQQQTNLLGFNDAQLLTEQQLPDTLDVRRTSFGLAFLFNRLDYRFNPRRGWNLEFSGSAGQKEIRRNQQIENLGLENLYDSLVLRSAQYRFELDAATYLGWGQNNVLKLGLVGGAILGQEEALANEQYRIGGNRLLRGFDEESIFATRYAVATIEYRFLLGLNSYLYVFGDIARIDTEAVGSPADIPTLDWPIGMGSGITFETRAGLFGLSLAFGRRNELPFDFGAPKVHFGYVSLF